ncbi:MAG: hypothetical protein CME59_09660 [Halioglobus sp.]|nr:hypothetical protein [Halioglobus sp.]
MTHSIIGTWEHVYPATQCTESNQFTQNGEFAGQALDEVISGSYTFEETVPRGERHELAILVLEDNEQADCFGRNTNSVGRSVTVFVSFNSPDSIEFYSGKTGGELIIDFVRVD